MKIGVIVTVLFALLCAVVAAEKPDQLQAKVRPADPETEETLVENRKRLEQLQEENKRLGAELAKNRTENIQKQTEDARKDSELVALRAKVAELESNRAEEVQLLSAEKSVLHKELIETLETNAILTKRLREIHLSAASIVESLNPSFLSERELELMDTLNLVTASSLKLARMGAATSDLLLRQLPSMKLDDVETAKIRVALEELRQQSGVVARLDAKPGSPDGFESCRILEFNEDQKVVVVSAGYRNGVRVSLSLFGGKDDSLQFRVIAVRPFVSAAVLERGKASGIAVGMELRAKVSKKE